MLTGSGAVIGTTEGVGAGVTMGAWVVTTTGTGVGTTSGEGAGITAEAMAGTFCEETWTMPTLTMLRFAAGVASTEPAFPACAVACCSCSEKPGAPPTP